MLRYEYKYIIPYSKMDRLRDLISLFMEPDPYALEQGGAYTVRSIYFDTPDLKCYSDKLEGVKRRHKVRLRGYNQEEEEGTVFFEIKRKINEPLTKNRAPMTYGEAKKVLQGDALEGRVAPSKKIPKAGENAQRFMYNLHTWRMQPVVTVIYEREPFQSILKDKANDLRITFDKNLRGQAYPKLDELYLEDRARPVDPAHFIMEIKFNRYLPSWIKPILAGQGLRKGPASKYAMCMELLGLTKTGRAYV